MPDELGPVHTIERAATPQDAKIGPAPKSPTIWAGQAGISHALCANRYSGTQISRTITD
jgi:hypothetical protein